MNAISPYWEEKVWGRVLHSFSSPYAGFSYLEVKRKTYCSIHKHLERANEFVVIKGLVEIQTFQQDFSMPSRSNFLREGESCIVPSEGWHRFLVLEDGVLVENYWPDKGGVCRIDDIVRIDEGGIM